MAVDLSRALRRSIGAAKLDVPIIEEAEADTTATAEAGVVLVVASIIGSLGLLFTNGLWGFITSIIIMIIGWFIWGWAAALIAEKLFGSTTTNTGEMMRVTGYASAVRVIGIIPFLGFVAFIWSIVAVVIGVRQAGELSTLQAGITAFLGLIPTIIGIGIVTAIVG